MGEMTEVMQRHIASVLGPESHVDRLHDESTKRLLAKLPPDQIDLVLNSGMCDIDPSFLGFVGIYERLAEIIPPDWTVVDLGCAYAPQAFLFTGHAAYIGVDGLADVRFIAANTTHYLMPTHEFIEKHVAALHLETTFAICSYVPRWHGDALKQTREAFKNVFTFYPATPAGRSLLTATNDEGGK